MIFYSLSREMLFSTGSGLELVCVTCLSYRRLPLAPASPALVHGVQGGLKNVTGASTLVRVGVVGVALGFALPCCGSFFLQQLLQGQIAQLLY